MEWRIEPVDHGSAAWRATVELRDRVLRAPLGLAFDAGELAAEGAQLHLALRAGPVLAGVVVLVPPRPSDRPIWKLRQMAVDPPFRGRGCGAALVADAEHRMRDAGGERVVLHARADAVGFYARLGYVAEGPLFVEVTIPHRRMGRSLRAG